VKKLRGSRNEYRLRVRDYRALFDLEGRTLSPCMLSADARTSIDEHNDFEIKEQDWKIDGN